MIYYRKQAKCPFRDRSQKDMNGGREKCQTGQKNKNKQYMKKTQTY